MDESDRVCVGDGVFDMVNAGVGVSGDKKEYGRGKGGDIAF